MISDGTIFKSHIGSSSFFNASIGIFLNSATFLYSSENSSTGSTVPSICSDLSPPKEALVSKTAAAICLFSFKALNLSPPSVKIQSAPAYQLYSSGVQRIKFWVYPAIQSISIQLLFGFIFSSPEGLSLCVLFVSHKCLAGKPTGLPVGGTAFLLSSIMSMFLRISSRCIFLYPTIMAQLSRQKIEVFIMN